ncbi:MAG: zinc-ribbon domain-containing protein [Rectinemataceae bacterium]
MKKHKGMTSEELEERLTFLESEWLGDGSGRALRDFPSRSHVKALWRCGKCGHTWRASIGNRVMGTNCPADSGRVTTEANSLATLRPDVAKMWDEERNGKLTPNDVTLGSHRWAFFTCEKGHSYQRRIYHMVNRGGCKFCDGQAATDETNLKVLYPELASQWHHEKNEAKRPEDFRPGSNVKVWWRCDRGHEWQAAIDKRALRGDGCPRCWTRASLVQLRVFAELKSIFADARLDETVHEKEVDIWLPGIKAGVEVDGHYYHADRREQDTTKSDVLKRNGIILFRLSDGPDDIPGDPTVHYKTSDGVKKTDVNALLLLLRTTMGNLGMEVDEAVERYVKAERFVAESEYRRLCTLRKLPRPGQSLESKFPEIASEWNYELNHPLTPAHVCFASNSEAWFTCPDCGQPYKAEISNRTDQSTGCPRCNHNRYYPPAPGQSLGDLHPQLVFELHPTLNPGIDVFKLRPQSNIPLFWICPTCHRVFSAPPNRRVWAFLKNGRYSRCRYCHTRERWQAWREQKRKADDAKKDGPQ